MITSEQHSPGHQRGTEAGVDQGKHGEGQYNERGKNGMEGLGSFREDGK